MQSNDIFIYLIQNKTIFKQKTQYLNKLNFIEEFFRNLYSRFMRLLNFVLGVMDLYDFVQLNYLIWFRAH